MSCHSFARSSVLRQAEHMPREDVSLNLVAARRDGGGKYAIIRPEHVDRFAAEVDLPAQAARVAGDFDQHLGQALKGLGGPDLEKRNGWSGVLARTHDVGIARV